MITYRLFIYVERNAFSAVIALIAFSGISVTPISAASIWDEELGSPLPFTWNYTNFDGFNVSGIGTENLSIVQTN